MPCQRERVHSSAGCSLHDTRCIGEKPIQFCRSQGLELLGKRHVGRLPSDDASNALHQFLMQSIHGKVSFDGPVRHQVGHYLTKDEELGGEFGVGHWGLGFTK